MEIQTQEYWLDPRLLLKVYMRRFFARRWWIFLLLVGDAIFLLILGRPESQIVAIGAIALAVLLPIALVLKISSTYRSSPIMKRPQETHFHDDELAAYSKGDLRAKIRYEDIIRVTSVLEGMQLWISKANYIFIPWSAFRTESDRDAVLARFTELGKVRKR